MFGLQVVLIFLIPVLILCHAATSGELRFLRLNINGSCMSLIFDALGVWHGWLLSCGLSEAQMAEIVRICYDDHALHHLMIFIVYCCSLTPMHS